MNKLGNYIATSLCQIIKKSIKELRRNQNHKYTGYWPI